MKKIFTFLIFFLNTLVIVASIHLISLNITHIIELNKTETIDEISHIKKTNEIITQIENINLTDSTNTYSTDFQTLFKNQINRCSEKIKDNITNHFKSTEITISHQKYVEIINDYGDTLDECFAAIIYEFEEKRDNFNDNDIAFYEQYSKVASNISTLLNFEYYEIGKIENQRYHYYYQTNFKKMTEKITLNYRIIANHLLWTTNTLFGGDINE